MHTHASPEIQLLTNQARVCFRPVHLPALAEFYQFVYHRRRRSHAGIVLDFVLRRAYALFRAAYGRPAWGTFDYLSGSEPKRLQFDARNTQFHAIYLPKFAEGYEPETSILLDAFLKETGVLWDIGSNWGYFPLYACARPNFTGEIHAFEPTASSFGDLESIVTQAGLQGRVHCHQLALGDTNGTSHMSVPDGLHSGLASLDPHGSGTPVQVATADSLQVPDPSVIKLDVEGHEAAVLQGALDVLARAKPVIIMENVSTDSVSSLEPLRLLETSGYQLYQPAWAFERDGVRCLMHSYKPPAGHQRLGLALVPMHSVERNLRREYANLLALPASTDSAALGGGKLLEKYSSS